MRIEINTGKTRSTGEDLATISKASVNLGWEINSVCNQLRQISQMEECQKALCDQQVALNVIAARLSVMGDALARIAESYNQTELKNSARLEECPPVQTVNNTIIYRVDQDFQERITRMLY